MAFLDRAKQIYAPPPAGSPYSVPLPSSEQPGRSPVYRHWRFQNELLKTLDPNVTKYHLHLGSKLLLLTTRQVTTGHQMFEDTGIGSH